MIRAAVPVLLLLSAGCTTTAGAEQADARDRARLERALAGLTPGEPVRCLHRGQYNNIRTFNDTILYIAGRNRIWRNDVVGSCPGLRRGDIVVTRSFGGQICAGDIIQTRARTGGFMSGICSLGSFTPYTRQTGEK